MPLIQGDEATFVWRGPIAPGLVGDFNHWDEDHPLRLKAIKPGLWALSMQLPADAYIEYAYLRAGERVPDPANLDITMNGFGELNHYFYMPGGRPAGLAQRQRGVPRGRLIRQRVPGEYTVVGGRRNVYFYQPPVSQPSPLVVVFDGQDYLRRIGLPHILDNLIHQKRIQPVALAMVANGGQARSIEYACNDATLEFLLESLLPAAREKLNLIEAGKSDGAPAKIPPDESAGSYGVLGASMGGLIALYTGLRLPHIFGNVLSQGGAFLPEYIIFDLVRLSQVKPIKIWMDVGKYDSLHLENQQMYALLASKGYSVMVREFNGGHNYPAWRDDVWRGLEALFG